MKLILGSNSTNHGHGYLDHMENMIRDVFGADRIQVAFAPFALKDHDGYATLARDRFERMGYTLKSLHETSDPAALLPESQALFIGGGNTFRLLNALYERKLLEVIRARVNEGMIYMGTSAGTNVATHSIKTTNDMPIIYPPSFDALALVPFNINPHFLDADPSSTHMGETREQRLKEFLEENSRVVVGLREGGTLLRDGESLRLVGNSAKIFFPDGTVQNYEQGSDLSFLLENT